MGKIIELNRDRSQVAEEDLTMDEYMKLHPEMLGEELDRRADELIERYGTQEQIEVNRKLNRLVREGESLGDSEFEQYKAKRISEEVEDITVQNLDLDNFWI